MPHRDRDHLRPPPAGRITWHGQLEREATQAELARNDIFIWPGIGRAYGLVYLEAQAAGLPVVAFDSGGVAETVRTGAETALLAPEHEEEALAAALTGLLHDKALRESMGAAARRFVRTERTTERAAERLAEGLALAMRNRSSSARERLAMNAAPWQALTLELDRWSADGRTVGLWLRDDDAVAPSPALDRLSEFAERFAAPVLLAVIPLLAEPCAGACVARQAVAASLPARRRPSQPRPGRQQEIEFGPERAAADVDAEIAQGWQRLRSPRRRRLADLRSALESHRAGPRRAPRRARLRRALMLPRLSPRSGGRPSPAHHACRHHRLAPGGRVGRRADDLLAELAALLADGRQRETGDVGWACSCTTAITMRPPGPPSPTCCVPPLISRPPRRPRDAHPTAARRHREGRFTLTMM